MGQAKLAGETDPSNAAALLANAILLHQNGQINEAIKSYQKVLKLDPLNFDAVHMQGVAAYQMGQGQLAEKFFRAALSIRPNSVDALNNLGMVLKSSGELVSSLDCLLKLIELCPNSPQGYVNLATVLCEMKRMNEATHYCQVAISLNPDLLSAHLGLGSIRFMCDDLRGALECFTRAHHLAPNDIDVLNSLALHKLSQGRPDEALPYLNQVLSQNPVHRGAIALMQQAATTMQDQAPAKESFYNAGLIDQAEAMARIEFSEVNSVENHNFLLKCYLVSNKHSAFDYLHECREWAKTHEHEELLPHPSEFKNDRSPDRRLRVGIVGDYFPSMIGIYTLYPFFKAYDRDKLEVYCYNFGPDESFGPVEKELRPIVDHYRDICQLSGQDFFELIRHDSIDIMLDINGRIRTPNYFETLLRQPAPIQINWYNLPCTVGVKAYNYAITDDYCVRDGEEYLYVEKIFRMPTGTICAWDLGDPPVVPRPPFEFNGYVTFGCFGDFFKVNEKVLATWADLLRRVPLSRLYLKSNNLRLVSERDRVSEFFRQHDIDPERLILEGMSSYNQMKKCYEWVDIALDTFPYSSGSTTLNALWQGVPVVTIEGNDWRGRSTAAVLAGCGMERFIAKNIADYIDMAAALATDQYQLVDLRAKLGRCLAASPQFQVEEFARNFESRLRMIWHDWLSQSQ